MCFKKAYYMMYTILYDCLYPDDIKYKNFGGLLDGPKLPTPFLDSECDYSDIELTKCKDFKDFMTPIYESAGEGSRRDG